VKYIVNRSFLLGLGLLCYFACFSGCSRSSQDEVPTQFLIKTDLISVSSSEFSEELELKKAAYPYNIKEFPEEYNEMVIHLINILSEEIALLSAALEKQVTVSDEELESAEKEFKHDYPGESFNLVLLENAIPYSLWKKKFKTNLIIDKLIDQELRQKIAITPEDIVLFYKNQKPQFEISDPVENNNPTGHKINREKMLIKRLRMKKTQESYDRWVKDIYDIYPVEINRDELNFFLIKIETDRKNQNEKSD